MGDAVGTELVGSRAMLVEQSGRSILRAHRRQQLGYRRSPASGHGSRPVHRARAICCHAAHEHGALLFGHHGAPGNHRLATPHLAGAGGGERVGEVGAQQSGGAQCLHGQSGKTAPKVHRH